MAITTCGTVLMRWARRGGRAAVLLGFSAGVVVLMLWLAGKFAAKVPVGEATAPSEVPEVAGRSVPARLISLPVCESAAGTIRAVHETSIGSKLLARVVEVNLKAGQKVQRGEVLLRLADSELRAKLQQAKAEVAAAEAVRAQAAADEKRYASLVRSKTISRQDYDKSIAALRSAEADLFRARRSSTRRRRRWIGPRSALPSTEPSSTRRSTWATW